VQDTDVLDNERTDYASPFRSRRRMLSRVR